VVGARRHRGGGRWASLLVADTTGAGPARARTRPMPSTTPRAGRWCSIARLGTGAAPGRGQRLSRRVSPQPTRSSCVRSRRVSHPASGPQQLLPYGRPVDLDGHHAPSNEPPTFGAEPVRRARFRPSDQGERIEQPAITGRTTSDALDQARPVCAAQHRAAA
jgi:hypothetical protein